MRLFIALSLSDTAKQQISDFQNKLQTEFGSKGIRYIPLENMHLTLLFLGKCSEEQLETLTIELQHLENIITPITTALESYGVFSSIADPKVVWVGITASDELSFLFEELKKMMLELGIVLDVRPFIPHLTAAYIKRAFSEEEQKSLSLLLKQGCQRFALSFDCLQLIESQLKPQGASYRTIKQYMFQGAVQ